MASSRKYLKRRREIEACITKIKYFDEGSAQAAAHKLRRDKDIPARVYRCPGKRGEQRHFHVTGGPKWVPIIRRQYVE